MDSNYNLSDLQQVQRAVNFSLCNNGYLYLRIQHFHIESLLNRNRSAGALMLTAARQRFFRALASRIGALDIDCVVLTHLLPDRPELLEAINRIALVDLVIGIPYSVDIDAKAKISQSYNVIVPTLQDLNSADALTRMISSRAGKRKFVILEIGGYFAPHLELICRQSDAKLAGTIEDTENGHRRYEAAPSLPCPVVSVARSPLKEAEDLLVGPSCLFSVETILRRQGVLLSSKDATVLGYGKVGRGTAHALDGRGLAVSVFDPNVARVTSAFAEGFRIPGREESLRSASLIFGCSGKRAVDRNDLGSLRSGCILVSCSSKHVEFDVDGLASDYRMTNLGPNLDRYDKETQAIFLLRGGAPVNFADGAVIGPVLSLVQGEMLCAIPEVLNRREPGIGAVREEWRHVVGEIWLREFIDPGTGYYKQ